MTHTKFRKIKSELEEYFNDAINEYLNDPDEIINARDDILTTTLPVLTKEALRVLALKTCITDMLIVQKLSESETNLQ